MPRRYLPPLSFEYLVSAASARQDKIQFGFQAGIVSDHAEEVSNFLHYLGTPPQDHPEHGPFGRIFNRQSRGEPPFATQDIRRRATSNQPLPLPNFGGHLNLRPVRGLPSTWSLDCLLSVNPTRFVRHQEFPIPASLMLGGIRAFAYSLDRIDFPPVHRDEWALADADNWIPDDRLWSMFASPRFWGRHLRSYLNGVVSQVQDDITRAANIAAVTIRPVQGNAFSLQTVETYWEFFADDAPSVVLQLEPLLQRYAASPVDARDYQETVQLDSPGNSRRLSLRTRVGERLTIYAKTDLTPESWT